jgi:hypothetical protein
MISNERLEELESYFWEESNDEDTQLWREDLSEEEDKLISEWDKKYNVGIANLCEQIILK